MSFSTPFVPSLWSFVLLLRLGQCFCFNHYSIKETLLGVGGVIGFFAL